MSPLRCFTALQCKMHSEVYVKTGQWLLVVLHSQGPLHAVDMGFFPSFWKTTTTKKDATCHSPAPPSPKHLGNLDNLAGIVLKLGRFAFSLCYMIYLARDGLMKLLRGGGKLSLSMLLQYRFYKLTTVLNLWISKAQFQSSAVHLSSQAYSQKFYRQIVLQQTSSLNFQGYPAML